MCYILELDKYCIHWRSFRCRSALMRVTVLNTNEMKISRGDVESRNRSRINEFC